MKFSEKVKELLTERKKFKTGDTIEYHGRDGSVIKDDGKGFVVVHFSDVDEEDSIDYDELITQGN